MSPTDPSVDVRAAANELLGMRREQRVEADLPAHLRPPDLETAYAVQDDVVAALSGGSRPIGYKVACTSLVAQAALSIDRPLFGRLLAPTTSASGATLETDRFVHRVVEAEIAFRIGRDVAEIAEGHTHETIADHIDAVIPAIEIVDHRFVSWAVGALAVAADNAIHGWWVHGDPVTDWRHLDLSSTSVEVRVDGRTVTTGSGAAVLGHPLTVMAWLADELPRFGRSLCAGDLVTTGVTTDVFEAASGETVTAEFSAIGTVELRFD
ncbi:MAG: fumarylacetoacetate hydrolase family protein [Ilumatobacteraceae bacterium]